MSPDDRGWYWCFAHDRPEQEGEQCAAENRLGPYATRDQAVHWRDIAEARNERWKEQDREWEGEDEEGNTG